VERLGVGGQGRGDQADVVGGRRDPIGDQDGVQPPADFFGISFVRRQPGRVEGERVLDGDEVGQAALGQRDQVEPVVGGEQIGRAG